MRQEPSTAGVQSTNFSLIRWGGYLGVIADIAQLWRQFDGQPDYACKVELGLHLNLDMVQRDV